MIYKYMNRQIIKIYLKPLYCRSTVLLKKMVKPTA